MNIKDQLTSLGWSVKTEFLDEIKGRIDEVKKQLLDTDIRQSGEKSLPETTKFEQTTKPYIVQLHKTRNVTAPKDNETSSHRPHLYRLSITDGHVFQNALVLPSLRNFNLDTAPGVKLLLKPKTKLSNGFYILNDQTCEVLGGNVQELYQKWKLNKLMGKHVRTLIGEGAPPPWVPFGTKHASATTVDTSQRSMDVAKTQQTNEEDPEFVRQRRAAIDTLLTGQVSKTERFATQDVIRGINLAKGFEQASQKMPTERPHTASVSSSSSVSNKPADLAAAAAAIKANTRLPEWAKNQIADEPIEDDKRRGGQPDRKQLQRRNFDDDDDDRPRRGGGRGRGRGGRGRGRDDDGGEETRPSKDVTLFDFFAMKSKSTTQKAPSTSKTQKIDTKPSQNTSTSNQSSRISSAVQKQIFGYDNGDQVLARYYEDNEYYPAIVMNIMHDTQKCSVMFEGYDAEVLVSFDDVEQYEEGYYNEEEEEYEQEEPAPPPPPAQPRNNPAAQNQQAPQQRNQSGGQYQQRNQSGGQHQQRNQSGAQYQQAPQQRNQPAYYQDQSDYGYYNQQQQQQQWGNQNRPNSGRGYPQQQQQQQQQQYPNRYNNNYYQ